MSQNQSQNMSQDVTDKAQVTLDTPIAAQSVLNSFQQALSLQNAKKADEAITIYQNILDQGLAAKSELTREQASAVSQNMSLIYFQKKEPALSYVYNQKALFLNERNTQAIEFQKQNKNLFQTVSIARDISITENMNSLFLKYFSVEVLFLFFALLTGFILKNIFQFLLARKRADNENTEAVKFSLKNYISLFFWLSFAFLLFIKISDESQLKAILKKQTVSVQASPGENQATVTQAEIGTLFYVLKLSNDAENAYVQVKYPGAYSGWLKRADLELLNSTQWPVFIDKK